MTGLAEDCSVVVSKPGLMMKFKALEQYTIEQVETAIMNVMRLNVYNRMPTTGTIIRAIEGTEDDRTETQIIEIRKEISRVGSYESPKFSDPITADLIRNRFGWSSICAMTNKELEFFSKEFRLAYLARKKETSLMISSESKQVLSLIKNLGNEMNMQNRRIPNDVAL